MTDLSRRRELRNQYKQNRPEAGVYRIVNSRNNKCLLGSTLNLASMRSKMQFARSTNSPGALDLRLRKDIVQDGIEAFWLEVLEVVEVTAEMTSAQIAEDLATLEQLWREKMDPSLMY